MFTALAIFVFRLKAWQPGSTQPRARRLGDDALGTHRKQTQPGGLTAIVPDSRLAVLQTARKAIREPRVTPKRLTLG